MSARFDQKHRACAVGGAERRTGGVGDAACDPRQWVREAQEDVGLGVRPLGHSTGSIDHPVNHGPSPQHARAGRRHMGALEARSRRSWQPSGDSP